MENSKVNNEIERLKKVFMKGNPLMQLVEELTRRRGHAWVYNALNSHEELVGMLNENLSAWEGEEDSIRSEHRDLISRLKKVIAQAEGLSYGD